MQTDITEVFPRHRPYAYSRAPADLLLYIGYIAVRRFPWSTQQLQRWFSKAVARSDADKARLSFNLSSAEIASTLKLAIQHEEDLVVSASAFVSEHPNTSAAGFDVWAESVQ